MSQAIGITSGDMLYILNFMTIVSVSQAILSLLRYQFDRFQCWYY
jgi:hypothetical protein